MEQGEAATLLFLGCRANKGLLSFRKLQWLLDFISGSVLPGPDRGAQFSWPEGPRGALQM